VTALAALVGTHATVAATSSRRAKIAALAAFLGSLAHDEIPIAVAFLAGELRQGRIGLGWAAVERAREATPAATSTLSLEDVDRAFADLAVTKGAGSAERRRTRLGELFAAATVDERDLLTRLVMGELRQGALEAVLLDAVAATARVPVEAVRRAVMLAGAVGPVAMAALSEGAAALARFGLELMRPVQPMLAQPAESLESALGDLGTAGLEWKLDGARVQVHKLGDEVRVFSRALNEVPAVPEVVSAVRSLPARAIVLDGEAIALAPDGRPRPFQLTMRRFGRDADDPRLRAELPLDVFFFDVLHLDGEDLLDRPARERARALGEALPAERRVPRVETASIDEARTFLEDALARGHEGIMAKSLDAAYEAGRRGAAWQKIKRAHTLDLVVLAVEPGSGRRRGWLSNVHLGARDAERGGFVMLGKTFKGMTDEMLAWQTERLRALEIGREGHVVHVRPELVVEVAFDGVQASPQYPGGVALRFARVKRYRPDKPASLASTIEEVRAIFGANSPEESRT
jgi:DNA ligase-1